VASLNSPTGGASSKPFVQPSSSPSVAASSKPSAAPSKSPTGEASSRPSAQPSSIPSIAASSKPSAAASNSPTDASPLPSSASPSSGPSVLQPSSSPSLDKSLQRTIMNPKQCCGIFVGKTNINDITDCGNAGRKWVISVSGISVTDGSVSPNCQIKLLNISPVDLDNQLN
jgi:hypothetical protein